MAYFEHVPDGNKGKIYYNRSIVNGIVLLAISEIEGVKAATADPLKKRRNKKKAKKSVKVKFTEKGIYVDVFVKINQSASVSDMAFKIQENIKHNVEAMTEYKLSKINVRVTDVIFDEEPSTQNQQ